MKGTQRHVSLAKGIAVEISISSAKTGWGKKKHAGENKVAVREEKIGHLQ